MDEPRWVPKRVVEIIHFDQLREHGGLAGVRDQGALESALERPRNQWNYGPMPDLAALAAAYGYGLVRSHPFQDGNKRVGFVVVAVFVELNQHQLHAADDDVVKTFLALAAGDLSEDDLANWLRSRITPG
jgi:death-on-curing protein